MDGSNIIKVLEFLFIPVTAGAVGYLTNALAIRMLFRPFRARWYTLGWQGLIPKTRGVLASSVAGVVGDKLVTVEEINKALSSPELHEKLMVMARDGLDKLQNCEKQNYLGDRFESFIDGVVTPLIESSLKEPAIVAAIDGAAADIVRRVLSKVGDMRLDELEHYLRPVADFADSGAVNRKLRGWTARVVRVGVHKLIYSGKTLNQLLPGKLDVKALSLSLSGQIAPMLEELFSRSTTADALTDIIIKYKNEQFEDKMMDKMKLGLVNMFFYDEKIEALVHEKLPELGGRIATDKRIKDQINKVIENKISEIINTPLRTFADRAGQDKYYAFLHGIGETAAANVVPESFGSSILDILNKQGASGGETLNLLLARTGKNINEFMPEKLPFSAVISGGRVAVEIKSGLLKLFSSIKNLPDTTLGWAASLLINRLLDILRMLMPGFLQLINIRSVVEEKINSLDMKEVEDMLFAFMKDHFKWINLLGLIIGFLVGVGQMLVILVYGK